MFLNNKSSDESLREYREREEALRTKQLLNSRYPAIVIPLAQGVISGFLLSLAAGTLSWLTGKGNPFAIALLALTCGMALFWFRGVFRWEGFVEGLEKISGIDLNQDGQIGEPETVRVEVKSEDGRQTQIAELPTSKEKLSDLARGLIAGQSFSEATWSGAGALFSRSEFRSIRDALIARGWMRWTDPEHPQQGIELTPPGRAVMRTFASMSGAHSPTLAVRNREK